MTQYKKDDIKEKINDSALEVFSEMGFDGATIAAISKRSKVSVGNIYKYYKSKEDIFYSVVPEAFADELKDIIKNKVLTWKEDKKPENNLLMNKSLTKLIMENRKKLSILFSGSKNTKYEGIREDLVALLIDLVADNYEINGELSNAREENRELLKIIFENLINMISNVMSSSKYEENLSNFLILINRYHTFGITGILK